MLVEHLHCTRNSDSINPLNQPKTPSTLPLNLISVSLSRALYACQRSSRTRLDDNPLDWNVVAREMRNDGAGRLATKCCHSS